MAYYLIYVIVSFILLKRTLLEILMSLIKLTIYTDVRHISTVFFSILEIELINHEFQVIRFHCTFIVISLSNTDNNGYKTQNKDNLVTLATTGTRHRTKTI